MNKRYDELAERLTAVVPSERQLKHQQLEFYAFVHFTVNTFTDKEWGDGQESPDIFNPEKLDACQWARAVKSAGMKGIILTCKHHDGFCLWPSKYTDHTVASSPWRGGRGDVVKEVADACRMEGLKFGIYLSPWDRNQPVYGKGKEYDDYFVSQLTELLTGYGDIFCVWFDGACGEGKNGKVQRYDWERYYSVIRKLQPGACISVCGPDVRWCGNEAGDTRSNEWSVVPRRLMDTEKIKENSQQADEESFRERKISSADQDLGSREALKNETDLVWYPAEVNVSIRPGWFYHTYEDEKVRSLDNLVHIYDRAVGGNATMLLNIPPTPEGLFHETDVKRLEELGDFLRRREAVNLAESGEESREDDGECLRITYRWEEPVTVSLVILMEDIRKSQRIERFRILDEEDGTILYEGGAVGYKKIAEFDARATKALAVEVLESRGTPEVSYVGIHGAQGR